MAWIAGLASAIDSTNQLINSGINFFASKYLQDDAQKFYREMSNTAHQREVKDLRLSGINPLYTATGGSGASSGTAGGGTFTGADVFANAGSIFLNGLATMNNIKNQTNATNADVALKSAQTQDVIGGLQERVVRMRNMLEERNLTVAKRHQLYAAIDETKANIKQLNSLTDFNISNAKYTNERSRGYSLYNADTWSRSFTDPRSFIGKLLRNDPYRNR